MEEHAVCPDCGQDNVIWQDGEYYCEDCGCRFSPEPKNEAQDAELLSGRTEHPVKVFISYAHVQSAVVSRIVEAIERRGHSVWFDQSGIRHGNDWRKRITDKVVECDGVLSFLSREAIRDEGVCLDELGIAVGWKYGNIRTVLLHKEEDLQPVPAQLAHRQWLDMSGWEQRQQEDPEAYQKWLDGNIAAIIRMIESDETREFVGEINRIREKLDFIDTAVSRQSWYLRQKLVEREWLNRRLENWLDNPDGGQLCVVYGGPGTGKSAFAARYAYYHSDRVAASLFFEHGNSYFNSAKAVLRELVFQLACRIPSYRRLLAEELGKIRNLSVLNVQEQNNRLLACPLCHTVNGGHETLAVLVDGLDECSPEDQLQVIGLLKQHNFPKWIRVVILSRPEKTIQDRIAPDYTFNLADDPESNTRDIRSYLAYRLEDQLDAVPEREKLLDALTARTEGVFLYACMVSDMIRKGMLDIRDTKAYPSGLSGTFDTWFSRYFPDPEEYGSMYRLPLNIIASRGNLAEPVPLEELENADGYEYAGVKHTYLPREAADGAVIDSVEERMKRCAVLLRYGENEYGKRTVGFAHQYMAEWLGGFGAAEHSSSRYSSAPKNIHKVLALVWRKRLQESRLTEYEVLNMPDVLEKAGESRDEIVRTVEDPLFGAQLKAYRDHYTRAKRWKLSAPFAYNYLAFAVAVHGETDEETIKAAEAMADIDLRLGEYMEELAYRKDLLEVKKEIYGETDKRTIQAMASLVGFYRRIGRNQDALLICEQKQDLIRKSQGEESEDYIKGLWEHAAICTETGNKSQALELRKQALALSEKVHGEDNPQTYTALGTLALSYSDAGRYQEALDMSRRVLDYRIRTLGKEHPDTVDTMYNIGIILYRSGNNEEALKQMYEADEINQKILDKYGVRSQRRSLSTKSWIVDILYHLKRYDEALEMEREVCNGRKQLLGPMHVDTQNAMSWLARLLHKQKKYTEEAEVRKELYEAVSAVKGEDDPDTADAKKKLDEAVQLLASGK